MPALQRPNLRERNLKTGGDDIDNNITSPNPTLWTLGLLGILIILLIIPFLVSKRRRMLCYRVLFNQRDNSNDEEDVENNVSSPAPFVRRYPLGDPRRKLTLEEAQEETERFVLDKLKPYSKVIEANDFFSDHDLVYATKNIEEEQGQDNSGTKQTSITSSSSQSTAISSNHSSSGVYAENESTNGDCILLTNEPQQGFLVEVGGTQQHQLLSPRDEEDLAQESFLNEKLKLPSPGVSLLVEYKSSTPSTTQNQCKNSVLTRTNKKSNDPEISSSIKPNKMKKEEEDKEVVSKNKQERMKQYREKCDSLVEEPGRASVSEESHCSSYCYRNNECSICLGSFSEGETVSWSGLDCEHVFHQQCILNWLTTKGQQSLDNRNHNNIIQSQIGRCDSMKCPNCRQDFIQSAKKK